jgi:hypothetical protein
LDSAVYSATLAVGTAVLLIARSKAAQSSTGSWRALLYSARAQWPLAVAVAGGAIVQFCFFRMAGDSWLPISALVKSVTMVREPGTAIIESLFILAPFSLSASAQLAALCSLAFTAAVALLWRSPLDLDTAAGSPLIWTMRLISIGMAIQFVVLTGLFFRYFIWYLSWTFAFWSIAAALLFSRAAEKISISPSWCTALASATAVAVVIASVILNGLIRDSEPFYERRLEAAFWVRDNLPEDAVIGAWNAGQMGFFSERRVVNLDGLINNREFLDTVLQHPTQLRRYMQSKGIRYLADYSFQYFRADFERNGGFELIKEFPLGNGTVLRVARRVD